MPTKKKAANAQIEESEPAEVEAEEQGGAPEEGAGAAEPAAAEPAAQKPTAAAAAPTDAPAEKAEGGGDGKGAEDSQEARASEVSAKQRQLSKAWGQYCKTVERQYMGTLQGVEREVVGVNKGLQTGMNAAHETHKNVRVAKEFLGQISQALENVDTLVVPIVLQRDGNF